MKLDPKHLEGKSRKVILKRANGSRYVATVNLSPSMTDQSFKEDADANTVLAKFMKTQDHSIFVNKPDPDRFVDFTEMPQDLLSAVTQVEESKNAFNTLPSKLREKFANNPTQLFDFLSNPQNREEAISLGLIPAPEPKPRIDVPIEPEPSEARSSKKPTPVVKKTDD